MKGCVSVTATLGLASPLVVTGTTAQPSMFPQTFAFVYQSAIHRLWLVLTMTWCLAVIPKVISSAVFPGVPLASVCMVIPVSTKTTAALNIGVLLKTRYPNAKERLVVAPHTVIQACPIHVQAQLWGKIAFHSIRREPRLREPRIWGCAFANQVGCF